MKLKLVHTTIILKTASEEAVIVIFQPCEPNEGCSGTWMESTVVFDGKEIDIRKGSGNPSVARAQHLASWAIKDHKRNKP